MKTETQEQIEKLQAELDRLKSIVNKETKFEVGKWYKCKDWICLYGGTYDNFGLFGGEQLRQVLMQDISVWQSATESEVLTAFTNYFRSKGFVSGKSKFRSAYLGREMQYKEELILSGLGDIVSSSGGILFHKDTLTIATIIEEEKLYVGENEVKFEGEYVFINDFGFSIGHIKLLLPLNPIFQKILDKLK